jgi:REP element-mobilizing transposase RayT
MPCIPRRQQQAVGLYDHMINRGHNREVVFRTEEDAAYFLHLVERYRQRFAVRLYHYCLMPNHFHVLVRAEDPKELSPWMAGLLRAYVHYHHRRTGFVGHLWKVVSRARLWRWRTTSSAVRGTSSGIRWSPGGWRSRGSMAHSKKSATQHRKNSPLSREGSLDMR